MKIAIITTGGTIGSALSNGYIAPSDSATGVLLNKYKNFDFDIIEPYTILSECLNADYLNTLIGYVENTINKNYDGIIITHGTDTLAYTAAALSLSFGNCKVPILLVSAGYELCDKRSNGYANFDAAMECVKNNLCGVLVPYKNDYTSTVDIHRGDMITLQNEGSENVFSLNNDLVAQYKNGKLTVLGNSQTAGIGATKYNGSANILVISTTPTVLNIDLSNIDAIIIKPYHSATLNCAGIEKLCKSALRQNISIYMPNARDNDLYITTKQFDNLGIKQVKSTFAYTFIKVWHQISNN